MCDIGVVDVAVGHVSCIDVLVYVVVGIDVVAGTSTGTGRCVDIAVGHISSVDVVVGIGIDVVAGTSRHIVVVVGHCTRVDIVVGIGVVAGTG